jgi:hypothetical protein
MDVDAPLLEGLTKSGFRLNSDQDYAGIYVSYLQRAGGYHIDVGASRMIIEGKINGWCIMLINFRLMVMALLGRSYIHSKALPLKNRLADVALKRRCFLRSTSHQSPFH